MTGKLFMLGREIALTSGEIHERPFFRRRECRPPRGAHTNWEDETIEFKEANDNFKTDEIGRYVSALSNEVNLAGIESAWLFWRAGQGP